MTLQTLIKKYRDEQGISQRQLAEACGLSNGYISMLEKGMNPKTKQPVTPTLQSLKCLANGMQMTMTDLFTEADDLLVDLTSDELHEVTDMLNKELSAFLDESGLNGEEISANKLDREIMTLILKLSPARKMEAFRYLQFLSGYEEIEGNPPSS